MTDHQDDMIGELLMQRVTGQLSTAEADALARATLPRGEMAAWERAAAELTAELAMSAQSAADTMPAGLAERVTRDGMFTVRRATVTTLPKRPAAPDRSLQRMQIWSGWLAAAAAVVLWVVAPRPRAATPEPVTVANPIATLRNTLLADSLGTRRLAWTAGGDSTARGATGEVLWNAAQQTGMMRFVGLAPNDAQRWQYQLWIFDRQRDQRYPVDGGVFDVPAGAREVLVPITAKVRVREATMFAVTVEAPGGVVVSTRERIALLAQGGE